MSHTEIAKSFGLTRACFSARVKAMLKSLGHITPRGVQGRRHQGDLPIKQPQELQTLRRSEGMNNEQNRI